MCSHTCMQTFKLILLENKHISPYYFVVLQTFLIPPLPLSPHVFADTSIYHTDYHSSKSRICKWLCATESFVPWRTTYVYEFLCFLHVSYKPKGKQKGEMKWNENNALLHVTKWKYSLLLTKSVMNSSCVCMGSKWPAMKSGTALCFVLNTALYQSLRSHTYSFPERFNSSGPVYVT